MIKIECNAQTKLSELKQQLEQSFGGVLGLDEAYLLSDECLEFLLTYLEDPDVRRNHAVHLLGYTQRLVDRLNEVNEGLMSRFTFKVFFGDIPVEQIPTVIKVMAEKLNLKLTDDAVEAATELLLAGRDSPSF